MSERLQLILQEIDNGTRKSLYNVKFTIEELLSKDGNGMTFLENLLKRNIDLSYDMKDIIKNNIDIARIYCENNESLYFFELSEEDLFSNIDGQTYLEYFISKNKLSSDMVSAITNNLEIVDILINHKEFFKLIYLNSEIINKLLIKNENGLYGIEKYINNEEVFDRLIPLINDYNVLMELCYKYNNYEWLKKVNENVLMSRFDENSSFLHYLINDKNIIPNKLKFIPYNKDFVIFLYNNNLYDYLVKSTESCMLFEMEPGKTLLEILIEKGYGSKITLDIYSEKTLCILKDCNKFELIGNVNAMILTKLASEVLKVEDALENETLLEYMLNKGYNPLRTCSYIYNEDVIRILYEKKRPDLLIKANNEKLFDKIDGNYTYFEYILENIKENKIRVSVVDLFPSGNDIDLIVKYYMLVAKYNMLEYINELTKDNLLKKYNGVMLLERLLEVDKDLTVNKLLNNSVKSIPEIAVILNANGVIQERVDVLSKKQRFDNDYLIGIQNRFGIGPLYQEGELLLNKLEQLFLSDGKSDKELISALISGYRHSLFVNYEVYISEIKNLISIKEKNLDKFYYLKSEQGSYFSLSNGSVYCDSLVIETLLHETGHALHYYLTNTYVPSNYHDVLDRIRSNSETLRKIEEYANEYDMIKQRLMALVEQKYQNFLDSYYDDDKKNQIREFLNSERMVKALEFEKLGIPQEQLDIIVNGMFTEEEYIEHQKRIFINQNVSAILRSEFGSFMAIGDILDAIYEGSLHSGVLKNQQGEKIKGTAGHGVAYYYARSHGFDEMVANFAFMSKSNDSVEKLELLKSIIGDELYNMLSEFYYQNISYGKEVELESGRNVGGK